MREIKFRAWDKENEVMCDVDVIGFTEGAVTVSNENVRYYHLGINEVVLMQSTDLKDKNGVEVFEGDYVSLISFETNSEHKGEIVYARGSFCIEVEVKGRKYKVPFTSFEESNAILEVIGNIYENPELLEEQNK